MDSIWMDGEQLPHFSSLEGSIKTDVLIIGGGMAGLLCALFSRYLARPVMIHGAGCCLKE